MATRKKRIEKVLQPGEKVIRYNYWHPAIIVYYTLYIFVYMAVGGLFLLWGWGENIMRLGINMSQVVRVIGYIIIGYSLYAYVRNLLFFYTAERALTNKRLVKCVGIFAISEFETNLADMQTINVSQSLLGRIFNYGNLSYSLKHQHEKGMEFMPDPFLLKRQIVEVRDALLAGKEVSPEEDSQARGDYSPAMEMAK